MIFRPKSRNTAAATPSCARRTAPWQRNWRGSFHNTTSERRYWSCHILSTNGFKTEWHRVWKRICRPQSTCKPAWDYLNCTNVKPHTSGPPCQFQTHESFTHFTQVSHLLAAVFQFYVAKAPWARNETPLCVKTTHKFMWLSSRTWKRSSNTETWKKSCWRPNSRSQTWCWRRQRRSTSWKESLYVLCIRFVECYKHFNNVFAILIP